MAVTDRLTYSESISINNRIFVLRSAYTRNRTWNRHRDRLVGFGPVWIIQTDTSRLKYKPVFSIARPSDSLSFFWKKFNLATSRKYFNLDFIWGVCVRIFDLVSVRRLMLWCFSYWKNIHRYFYTNAPCSPVFFSQKDIFQHLSKLTFSYSSASLHFANHD